MQLSNPTNSRFKCTRVNLPSRELTHPTHGRKIIIFNSVLVRGYVASQESNLFHQLERCSKPFVRFHEILIALFIGILISWLILLITPISYSLKNSSESWLKKCLSSIYHPYFFHCLVVTVWNRLGRCFSFPFGKAIFHLPWMYSGVKKMFTSHFSPLSSYNWIVSVIPSNPYNPTASSITLYPKNFEILYFHSFQKKNQIPRLQNSPQDLRIFRKAEGPLPVVRQGHGTDGLSSQLIENVGSLGCHKG